MKLLLNGKKRSIYFRKNNTAYYKSKGSEIDITNYFKKKGGLKKQYSNLLVEKKLVGGVHREISFNSNEIFNNPIRIKKSNIGEFTSSNKQWDIQTIRDIYKKMLYVFLICKINLKVNGELFKNDFKDRKKLNATIKIKKIISILNGNTFELYNIGVYNINRFSQLKYNPCGKTFIELKLTDDAIFDVNPNKINIFTTDDSYYVTLLNNVTFELINEKIKFINSFDFNITPDIKLDYKYALNNEVSVSKNTNLDLLKIIMINEGLFDTLNTDDAIDDIKKSTPNYCDLDKILKEYKEEYLKIFDTKIVDKNNTEVELNNIIDVVNMEIEKDKQLKKEFEDIWETHIKSIEDYTDNYKIIHNDKYKLEKQKRNENSKLKEQELDKLKQIINNLGKDKITEDTRQYNLLKIERIKSEYIIKGKDSQNLLSSAYNPLIKYYIDQITESIGRLLTTYLSVRNLKVGGTSKIAEVNDIADNKKSIKFDTKTFNGFNKIFGNISIDKTITSLFDNEQKFEAMLPLFDKLKTSDLAILLFGYGYSGSGKTYTLFGGIHEDKSTFEEGITQKVIRYFLASSKVNIKAIYELYNDTYNILNAVSGDRNPYDSYTKKTIMEEYIPHMRGAYNRITDEYVIPDNVFANNDAFTKTGHERELLYAPSRPGSARPGSARPGSARPGSAAIGLSGRGPGLGGTSVRGNIVTGGKPEELSDSFYYYYETGTIIRMSDDPINYDALKKKNNPFHIPPNADTAIDQFKIIYNKIEELRKQKKHIMPTANNQFSSRGHLFIDLEIITHNGEQAPFTSYLTICDMGGRENPNNLLLETKIYNMLNSESGGDNNVFNRLDKDLSDDDYVDRPYIISKDHDTMYTFDIPESKPTSEALKTELKKLPNYVINDRYPGILQLYKSFYSSPLLLEYFYNLTKFDLMQAQGTGNTNYIRGRFSNMSSLSMPTYLRSFYTNFFKCIKQGFYINDSINQLLRQFGSTEIVKTKVKAVVNNSLIKPDGTNNKFCDLDKLELKITDGTYGNYGWYNSRLPSECFLDGNVYKGNLQIPVPRISGSRNFQYNPGKITLASELDKKNIGISELFSSFGTGKQIPRKYVVIGCIRDSENFIEDDKLTLSFLQNVSTSRLTDGIGAEVKATEAGARNVEEDEELGDGYGNQNRYSDKNDDFNLRELENKLTKTTKTTKNSNTTY